MKKIILVLFTIFFLFSCKDEDSTMKIIPEQELPNNVTLNMFIASTDFGPQQIFYYDKDFTVDITIEEVNCYNQDYDCEGFNYFIYENDGLNSKPVKLSNQNTATLKSCHINRYLPVDSIGEQKTITIKCNNKKSPATYTMEDLYSPNNVWDGSKWIRSDLKAIFIDAKEFETSSSITSIGYQIAIGGIVSIGTGSTKPMGADNSCKSPINAIAFVDGFKFGDISLNLRTETGEDINVDVVIKNQNGEVFDWLINQKITSSYPSTPYVFPASKLDIENNCYTVVISKSKTIK